MVVDFMRRRDADFEGQNRRRSQRIHTRNLMRVNDELVPNEDTLTNLVDLSESGAQFIYSRTLKTQSVVQVIINLAEYNKQISLLGRVVWSKPGTLNDEVSRIGLSFLGVGENNREVLRRFITQSLKNSDVLSSNN